MISLTTALFLAAALVLPPVSPDVRVKYLRGEGPKTPRDGPRGAAPPVSAHRAAADILSLIHISEPTRPAA